METNNKYRKLTTILDILMIIGMLSNFGALVFTNAMVAKTRPQVKYVEVNPIAAEAYDLEQAPKEHRMDMLKQYGKKLIHLFCLGISLGIYLWMRSRATHWRDYLVMSIMVATWFTILFFNFANDFGFWLGKLIYSK